MNAIMDTTAPHIDKRIKLLGLMSASSLCRSPAEPKWNYDNLIGRLVELSGVVAPATLTVAVGLVRAAQKCSEPVAWITIEESAFFPPDVARHGIDLEALVVVRVPHAHAAARSADTLIRSGAFGLVLLDLGKDTDVPIPLQARLAKLAQRRKSAVVCLTIKPSHAPSLSSLVSLRGEARRVPMANGSYTCEVRILKDKQRSPAWVYREECRGPVGLR